MFAEIDDSKSKHFEVATNTEIPNVLPSESGLRILKICLTGGRLSFAAGQPVSACQKYTSKFRRSGVIAKLFVKFPKCAITIMKLKANDMSNFVGNWLINLCCH